MNFLGLYRFLQTVFKPRRTIAYDLQEAGGGASERASLAEDTLRNYFHGPRSMSEFEISQAVQDWLKADNRET